MPSPKQFVENFKHAVTDLRSYFPDNQKLKTCYNRLDLLLESTYRLFVQEYYDSISPYEDALMDSNTKVFFDNQENIEVLQEIDARNLWKDMTETQRSHIWTQIQNLYMDSYDILFPEK